MPSETYSELRLRRGAPPLNGNALIAIELNGETEIITVDELSQVISGQTVSVNAINDYRGSLVTAVSKGYGSTGYVPEIEWDAIVYDTENMVSQVGASEIVVAPNITKLEFKGGFKVEGLKTLSIGLYKNGTLTDWTYDLPAGNSNFMFHTPTLPVSGGDIFEFVITVDSGSVNVSAWCEAIVKESL